MILPYDTVDTAYVDWLFSNVRCKVLYDVKGFGRFALCIEVESHWPREGCMMEYSVGRGVACCGLLCFHVGEFGNSALLVFKGDPASVGGPKTRRLCSK